MRSLSFLFVSFCVLSACGEDEMHAPFAPWPDGSTRDARPGPGPTGGHGDAGRSDGGGAADDGGTARGCVEIAADDPDNQLVVTGGSGTEPFTLSAAYVRWFDCTSPTLLVGLTDGSCEPGVGQQLLFAIDGEAIGTMVTVGDFILSPDPSPLRVTFSQPVEGAPESRDVFGTCSSDVFGTVTFESVASGSGGSWIARFDDVELGSCDATRVDSVILDGAFDLVLDEDLADVCP